MFYDKILSHLGHVKLDEESFSQYEVVGNDIDKLCELTNDDWGLIHDRWFCEVRHLCFIAGGLFGVILSSGFYLGTKVIKKIRKPKD